MIREIIYERMNVKIYHIAVLVGLVFGFALDCRSVGFESSANRRVEAPRMRRVSSAAKSDASAGDYSVSSSVKTTASSRDSRRSVNTSATSSLLPDGFDSEDGTQQKTSSSLAKQKVFSSDGLAMKDDIKVEYGEGCGETTDEALKEAMKDVLQKVVGVYVDSDFRMNNDKIIKDEIITHSNGFIDHYKKMDESVDPNGRGKVVTIKAWVKMRDFVNRMQKIAPKQTVKVDGLLLDNELENNCNAETLLRKEFENFDPVMDLMEVRLVDSIRPEIQSSDADSVVLRYVFVIKYSKEKYYRQFVVRLNNLLNQVCTKKLSAESIPFKVARVECFPMIGNKVSWNKHQIDAYYLHHYFGSEDFCDVPGVCRISLVQNITKGGVASVNCWRLPEHLGRAYKELRERYLNQVRDVKCSLKVLDDYNKPLSISVQRLPTRYLVCNNCYTDGAPDFMPLMDYRYTIDVEMTRNSEAKCAFGSGTAYMDRYVGCIDITIDKTDVKKIKSAEIKLETNKKGENE